MKKKIKVGKSHEKVREIRNQSFVATLKSIEWHLYLAFWNEVICDRVFAYKNIVVVRKNLYPLYYLI